MGLASKENVEFQPRQSPRLKFPVFFFFAYVFGKFKMNQLKRILRF